jgi:hypothetical protein
LVLSILTQVNAIRVFILILITELLSCLKMIGGRALVEAFVAILITEVSFVVAFSTCGVVFPQEFFVLGVFWIVEKGNLKGEHLGQSNFGQHQKETED